MRLFFAFAAALGFLCSWSAVSVQGAQEFPVPPPPLSEDYFPCAELCHRELKTDPTPRKLLEEHEKTVLHHAEQFRWCLDCHDAQNRDKLHLQSGDKLDFTESYRLCGQCHGDKYRLWKRGVHGKRTGRWDGEKQYLLCAHCHNPHSPRFAPIEPMGPPMTPGSAGSHAQTSGAHAPAEGSAGSGKH